MESTYQVKQEESEYLERQRVEAEQAQIDKENETLLRIAESEAKGMDVEGSQDMAQYADVSDNEVREAALQSHKNLGKM